MRVGSAVWGGTGVAVDAGRGVCVGAMIAVGAAVGVCVGVGVGSGVWISEQAAMSAITETSRAVTSVRARSEDLDMPRKWSFPLAQFDPGRAVAAALSWLGAEVPDGAVVSQVFADYVSERAGSSAVYHSEFG